MLPCIAAEVPLTSVICLMLAIAIDFSDCFPLLLLNGAILLNSLVCGIEECLVIKLNSVLKPLHAEPCSFGCTAYLSWTKI